MIHVIDNWVVDADGKTYTGGKLGVFDGIEIVQKSGRRDE